MKTKLLTITVVILLSLVNLAIAETQVAGPKGGRLLEGDGIKAEFFIEKDHNVSLTFYNDKLETISVTNEKATMIAEAPSGKKKIEFENRDGNLFSKDALPNEHGYNVVLQLKKDDTAKAKNFRIPFNTDTCAECGRAEYACTCEGH